MKPSIGRVVVYNTTEDEQKKDQDSGTANKQEKLPAIVVAVWSDTCVNLSVIKDGEGTRWVTSALIGDGPGQWNWPVREA